jgi:hypothetical protein
MHRLSCSICQMESGGTFFEGSTMICCTRCGEYEIGNNASHEISFFSPRQKANLSGWIREHQRCKILTPDLARLASLRTPTVGEKAQKLLEHFAAMNPKSGAIIDITIQSAPESIKRATVDSVKKFITVIDPEAGWTGVVHPKLLAWSWSEDFGELAYLIRDYLVSETGAIKIVPDGNICITPKGWAQLDSQRIRNSLSQVGFIAMWFDSSVEHGAQFVFIVGPCGFNF